VKKFNSLDVDPETLLKLWERAQREWNVAKLLFLADSQGQRQSTAFHLFRGWHALVSLCAHEAGLPEPELESFVLERESKLLTPIPARLLLHWNASFKAVRQTALVRPWYAAAHEPDAKHLRLQARLLERCLAVQRRRVMKSHAMGRGRRIGLRQVLTVIAVLVLVIAVVDLGRRLVGTLGKTVDTQESQQDVPETRNVNVMDLSDPKPRGYGWDGPGNVTFGRQLVVSLVDIQHPDALRLSLDGNDRYSIGLMEDSDQVGILRVGPSQVVGLELYILTVPEEATERGIDSIVIEGVEGDGNYSLGHLLLDQDHEGEK
jgi:hypothetical protein